MYKGIPKLSAVVLAMTMSLLPPHNNKNTENPVIARIQKDISIAEKDILMTMIQSLKSLEQDIKKVKPRCSDTQINVNNGDETFHHYQQGDTTEKVFRFHHRNKGGDNESGPTIIKACMFSEEGGDTHEMCVDLCREGNRTDYNCGPGASPTAFHAVYADTSLYYEAPKATEDLSEIMDRSLFGDRQFPPRTVIKNKLGDLAKRRLITAHGVIPAIDVAEVETIFRDIQSARPNFIQHAKAKGCTK